GLRSDTPPLSARCGASGDADIFEAAASEGLCRRRPGRSARGADAPQASPRLPRTDGRRANSLRCAPLRQRPPKARALPSAALGDLRRAAAGTGLRSPLTSARDCGKELPVLEPLSATLAIAALRSSGAPPTLTVISPSRRQLRHIRHTPKLG